VDFNAQTSVKLTMHPKKSSEDHLHGTVCINLCSNSDSGKECCMDDCLSLTNLTSAVTLPLHMNNAQILRTSKFNQFGIAVVPRVAGIMPNNQLPDSQLLNGEKQLQYRDTL